MKASPILVRNPDRSVVYRLALKGHSSWLLALLVMK